MSNPRKDKILIKIWLSEKEIKELKKFVKSCIEQAETQEIMMGAYERGDIIW